MLFSRVGVNEPVLTGKEEEHVNNFNFNEYKKFMKDIKNEYPHLSISAQQQLAIERCAKLNEDRQSQDSHASSPPKFSMPNILGDVMAKLHFNLSSEENGIVDDHPTNDDGNVKRTIQARPSGRFALSITDQKMLQEFDCSDSDNDDVDDSSLAADSLTNSLQNIETTSFMFEKQPQHRPRGRDVNNMSVRCSRRLSGLSALSDVDENEIEELNDSDPDIIGEDEKINNQSAYVEEVTAEAQCSQGGIKKDNVPIRPVDTCNQAKTDNN